MEVEVEDALLEGNTNNSSFLELLEQQHYKAVNSVQSLQCIANTLSGYFIYYTDFTIGKLMEII